MNIPNRSTEAAGHGMGWEGAGREEEEKENTKGNTVVKRNACQYWAG